jgi:hypothetical protein
MTAEAIRIPSAGALFWAEARPGGSGSGSVRAIAGRPPLLQVSLSAPLPSGISAIIDSRGVALMASPQYYDHLPTAAELATPPAVAPVTVQGTVQSLDGRFFPRQFSVTSTPGTATYVPLRPSLQATRITEAGALVLTLRWQDRTAASWSILNLSCVRNGVTLGFTGQADRNGDIIVPLTGLPPLVAPQTSDQMTVTALGDPTQSGQATSNPDALNAAQLSIGGAFAAQQTITVTRGRITTAATLAIPGITLQST